MTIIGFANRLLCRCSLGLVKARPGTKTLGIDWVEDAGTLLGRVETIFDIGANRGQTSKRLARRFPEAQLHCFEPTPQSFLVLKERLQQVSRNAHCHQLAFGAADKQAAFQLREHHEANSFLNTESSVQETNAKLRPVKFETVEMRSLDRYCQDLPQLDILKINAEGYDLEILKGGASLLEARRIRLILAEVLFQPLFVGQPDPGDFLAFLKPRGYHLAGLYEPAYHPSGCLLWAQGLFLPRLDVSS